MLTAFTAPLIGLEPVKCAACLVGLVSDPSQEVVMSQRKTVSRRRFATALAGGVAATTLLPWSAARGIPKQGQPSVPPSAAAGEYLRYLTKVADVERFCKAIPDWYSDSDEDREYIRLCEAAAAARPVLELEYGKVRVEADSGGLRHRVDLFPFDLKCYHRNRLDDMDDETIDGEDFVLIYEWLEEIGFLEAVKNRKTYSSLMSV